MNDYERICKEWLKGCTDSRPNHPEDCEDCTNGLLSAIKNLNNKRKHDAMIVLDRAAIMNVSIDKAMESFSQEFYLTDEECKEISKETIYPYSAIRQAFSSIYSMSH